MHPDTRRALETSLGDSVVATRKLSGGCISEAFACRLGSGTEVFVKCNTSGASSMFAVEARGLAWLAEARALRVPTVLAVAGDYLVLEYIALGSQAPDYEETLGRGLAALHDAGAVAHGLGEEGYLATLHQDNRQGTSWPSFYVERRLRPLLRQCVDRGLAPRAWAGKFETLFVRLPTLVGDSEKPARLHGDLWSGNLHCDSEGQPVLIDPAAYGGHREIDLAMLELFGSSSERFYASYNERWPLAEGYRERFPLYQLYPLLAHICLFGSSYNERCLSALESYL